MANIQQSVNQALQSLQFGMAFIEKRPQVKQFEEYHQAKKKTEAYEDIYNKDTEEATKLKSAYEEMVKNPTRTATGQIATNKDVITNLYRNANDYSNSLQRLKTNFPDKWTDADEAILKSVMEDTTKLQTMKDTAKEFSKKAKQETIIALAEKIESTNAPKARRQELEKGGSK